MSGARIYTVGDSTYEIHGLDAKADTLRDAASTAGTLVSDLSEAAAGALRDWTGPHATYFAMEVGTVIVHHLELQSLLSRTAQMLEDFPDAGHSSLGALPPYWIVDDSTSSADVDSLRTVAAALRSNNSTIVASGDDLNLDGITVTVSYPAP